MKQEERASEQERERENECILTQVAAARTAPILHNDQQ